MVAMAVLDSNICSNDEVWKIALSSVSPAARKWILKATGSGERPVFHEFVIHTLEADADRGKVGALSVALLSGVVTAAIANPMLLTLDDAIRLARAASRLDAGLDYKILSHLTRGREWPAGIPKPEIMRVLTVIDAISDCDRLVVPLMKFAKLRQPHLRSKAVKLLARANQNPAWADLILLDPNPRVRANLIGEISATIGVKARHLLRRGTQDRHHRVATTALLELSKLGDEGSRTALNRLADGGDETQRKAAAWALRQLEATPSTTAPHPTV
jgi:hypothetical protein